MPKAVSSASTTHKKDDYKLPVLLSHLAEKFVISKGSKKKLEFWSNFYGAAWYPFAAPGEVPVLAVVGGTNILIVRPCEDEGMEILRVFQEEDFPDAVEGEDFCTIAWAKRSPDGDPVLLVAGHRNYIRVLDPFTGKLVQVLYGHGGYINELQTCPTDPSLVASCCDDQSVKIWSLREEHMKAPLAATCGGIHASKIQHCSWHSNGRYILSAGNDYMVCLWAIPELPNENTGTDKVTQVFYPVFSSSHIHTHDADCCRFLGDLILSKCMQEDSIICWRILGFDSTLPPPPMTAVDIRHGEDWKTTTSAFRNPDHDKMDPVSDADTSAFEKLFRLHCACQDSFYNRFDFSVSDTHDSILAIGSVSGLIYFWNLNTLLHQLEQTTEKTHCTETEAIRAFYKVEDSTHKSTAIQEERLSTSLSDPFCRVIPHNQVLNKQGKLQQNPPPYLPWSVPRKGVKYRSSARGCVWSLGGGYLAVVGDNGNLAIYGYPKERPPKTGKGKGKATIINKKTTSKRKSAEDSSDNAETSDESDSDGMDIDDGNY